LASTSILNPAFGEAPASCTVELPISTVTEPPTSSYERISLAGGGVVLVVLVVVGGGLGGFVVVVGGGLGGFVVVAAGAVVVV
jgi:hypothetical protein